MRTFFVADLSAQGELQQINQYDYASLEQIEGAVDLIARCSAEIWKNPAEADIRLTESFGIRMRWRAVSDTSGIAVVRSSDQELASLSLLAAGKDPAADKATFDALQQHLLRELRGTPYEPAFDLVHLKQRPLLASISFPVVAPRDQQWIYALSDRALGAAFFRYLGLA